MCTLIDCCNNSYNFMTDLIFQTKIGNSSVSGFFQYPIKCCYLKKIHKYGLARYQTDGINYVTVFYLLDNPTLDSVEYNNIQPLSSINNLQYKNLYITALTDLSINNISRCSKFILVRNGYYLYFPTYIGAGTYSNPNYSYFTNYQILPNLSYQLYLLGKIVFFLTDDSSNLTLSITDNINNLPSAGGIIIPSDFIFTESANIINSSCINLNDCTNANIKLNYMDIYTSWLATIEDSNEIDGIIYKSGTNYFFAPILQGYTDTVSTGTIISIGNHATVTFTLASSINPVASVNYTSGTYSFNFPVDQSISLYLVYNHSFLPCQFLLSILKVSNNTAEEVTLLAYTPYQVYIICK